MSSANSTRAQDFGRSWWFRLLTGVLGVLVLGLSALGVYTMNPDAVVSTLTSGYLLSTLLFAAVLGAVVYVFRKRFPVRTPSNRQSYQSWR